MSNQQVSIPCVSHRTYVSYKTQNIHSYFSTFACLFFQSHGMIYWGSSDPILIISMVVHFICLSISNTTTYMQEININFLKVFAKNIFYIISFIGFWCLASDISRPRFLLAQMFASIILLIIIYGLYTSSQVKPADQEIINQKQDSKSRQNKQQNKEIETKNGENNQQKEQINENNKLDNQQPKNKHYLHTDDISSLNNNPEQSKQQINKQFMYISKKDEEKDQYETRTPQQIGYNGDEINKNCIKIPQTNTAERISFNNNSNQAHNEEIQVEIKYQNPSENKNIQITEYAVTENNHTQIHSGRDGIQFKIHSNMDQLSQKTLTGFGLKEHIQTDGENAECIKFDDESVNTQTNNRQIDFYETPQKNQYQDNNNANNQVQKTENNDNKTESEMNQPKKQPVSLNQVPTNQDYLKPTEVQHNQDLLIQHEPQIVSKMSIDEEENNQNSKKSKKDLILEHILNAICFVILTFYMCMNYTNEFFVLGLKYLNKPMASFKIINIVFLFTFDISFNSFSFFPGLRVISIICGVVYLIIEIQYLIKFDYKNSFIYEIFQKLGAQKKGKKQAAQNNTQNTQNLQIEVQKL